MIPQAKHDLRKLYDVYREEGVIAAGKRGLRGISQLVSRLHPRLLFGRLVNASKPSTSIWERDWDICVILDGCRADTFEATFSGDSSRIRSVASTSGTWISRTLERTDTSAVAYVTANPHASALDPDDFAYFHFEPVQRTEYGIETAPPPPLTDHTIHAWRNRDRLDVDRVVVHFMQPHAPFRQRPELFDEFLGTDGWGSNVWESLGSDAIDRDEFFEAYRDNLDWVLEEGVSQIQQNCDATIALTADHGNAAGEWGYYGHPEQAPVSSVRTVPWAVIDGVNTENRTPAVDATTETVDIEKQLQALGYK